MTVGLGLNSSGEYAINDDHECILPQRSRVTKLWDQGHIEYAIATINSPLYCLYRRPCSSRIGVPQAGLERRRAQGDALIFEHSEPTEHPLLVVRHPMETAVVWDQIFGQGLSITTPANWGGGQLHHKELKARLIRNTNPLFSLVDLCPERSPAFSWFWFARQPHSTVYGELPSSSTYVQANQQTISIYLA